MCHVALAVLALSSGVRADQLALPRDIGSYTGKPYRVAFCFSFARDYEIPENLQRRILGEAQVNMRKTFGKTLALLALPRKQEDRLQALLETLGVDRLSTKDMPDLGSGVDRVVLVRISKKWNEYAIAFREYLPETDQLTLPVRTATCRSDLVAWTFTREFWRKMRLEAYVAAADDLGVTARFKAQNLAAEKGFFCNDGDVYSIWWTHREDAREVRRLDHWFVVARNKRLELVGDALPPPDPTCYCKIVREIAQGGSQPVRLVSKERPEYALAEYSVLTTYFRPFHERNDFVGVTDTNGEISVGDSKGRPLHIRVEKKRIILKDFVMLVRPNEGTKVVDIQEFSDRLPELIGRCREIREEVLAAYAAVEQKLKAAEKASDPNAQIDLLRKAQAGWPDTTQPRRKLKEVKEETERSGLDISSDVASVCSVCDEIDSKKPDFAKLIEEVGRAGETVNMARNANDLEAQAMDIWRKSLDWEAAAKKLEEAIKLAPDSAERRRKVIDSMRPKNTAHAEARQFVLRQLRGLTHQRLKEGQEEIKRHVDTLMAEKDVLFLARAVEILSDHSSEVLKEAAKRTEMCAKAANDDEAKKCAAESEQLIALHEALSTLITQMTGAMAKDAK